VKFVTANENRPYRVETENELICLRLDGQLAVSIYKTRFKVHPYQVELP
jgi:hypothetical protein